MILWIFAISMLICLSILSIGLATNSPTLILIASLGIIMIGVFVITEGFEVSNGVVITENPTNNSYIYNRTTYSDNYTTGLGIILALSSVFIGLWTLLS